MVINLHSCDYDLTVIIEMTVGMMRNITKANLNTWYCFSLAYYRGQLHR